LSLKGVWEGVVLGIKMVKEENAPERTGPFPSSPSVLSLELPRRRL